MKTRSPVWLFLEENKRRKANSQLIVQPQVNSLHKKHNFFDKTLPNQTFTPSPEKLDKSEMKIVQTAISQSNPISPRYSFYGSPHFHSKQKKTSREMKPTSRTNQEEHYEIDDSEDISLISPRVDDSPLFSENEQLIQKEIQNTGRNCQENQINYNKMVMDEIHNIIMQNKPNCYEAKPFSLNRRSVISQHLTSNSPVHMKNISNAQQTNLIIDEISSHSYSHHPLPKLRGK